MTDESLKGRATTVSTVNLAGGKPKIMETQKEKRSHSEVADSSLGDEFTSIQKQLDQLTSDIQQTREDVKSLMKKEEMRTFITDTITALFSKVQKKIEKKVEDVIEEKLEEKLKDKMTELNDRMDSLVHENIELREANDKLKARIDKNEKVAQSAMEKSNMNEQYSRKNNIKVMGVVEDDDETEDKLIEKINNILNAKAGVTLNENKIVAIHRIPGRAGMPKPVLIKLMNNNGKTKIMKKRKFMKLAGYRLVDDVTKQNTKLINRLNLHTDIDSAWYFNGNVFAKTTEGKRFRFDLFSVVEDVIQKKGGATSTIEDISDGAPLPAEEVMDYVISNL